MSNDDIAILMSELSSLTYYSSEAKYKFDVIHKPELTRVEEVIRKYLLELHDHKLAELEAKVYTYEKIIANSNFSPILDKKDKWTELKYRLKEELQLDNIENVHHYIKCVLDMMSEIEKNI